MIKDDKINVLNIGLMLLSCAAAFIMPFEVFLFAYAVMGPLHYLTEISWLHDRQYFAKGKYDVIILWIIGILILLENLAYKNEWNWPFKNDFYNKIIFIALCSALLMVFVKNVFVKVIGLLFVLIISNSIFKPDQRDGFTFFLGALLPTLVHVYVFTGFFILYGALKSRNKTGILSFIVFVICPFLLFYLFADKTFISVTQYGMQSYGNPTSTDGFFGLNVDLLNYFFGVNPAGAASATNAAPANEAYNNQWINLVFHSKTGILLMRFIAFAYTYHYLNWFSKTEVIRWHKVPKMRFAAVIILWIISLGVYIYDYALGLNWLFFLSFCHVLLEFPLNMVSIVGIGKEMKSIAKTGFKPALVSKK